MFQHYYLHFRDTVDPASIAALKEAGVSVQPEFETSFSLGTELSFGQMKRILKTCSQSGKCILIKVKNESELSVLD